MRFISIPNSFLLHLNKEKNTFIFLKKKKKKRSFEKVMGWEINVSLGRGSALPRLGAELELRRSGSSLGPSQ